MPVRLVAPRATPAQLLEKAKARARRPEIFDQNPPVFITAVISNNGVDAYFTRMAPSSLRNFAEDAKAGVSFQDSHLTNRLGLGWSLDARYIEDGENGAYVEADFYVVPGIREIDEFLHRLDAGIANDVSIGFYGGEFRCSICNQNIWSYRCAHWPGVEYEIEERNDQGEVISSRVEMAVAWVDEARLSEVSAVYDGATPGCVITKVQNEIQAGRMTPQIAGTLARQYRNLSFSPQHFSNPARAGKLEAHMETQASPAGNSSASNAAPATVQAADGGLERAQITEIRAALATLAITETDPVAGVRALAAHVRELSALAELGRQFRSTLIESALAEGVRAKGDKFERETWATRFAAMPVEEIEATRAVWAEQASAALPAGRQTQEQSEEPQERNTLPLPASIFG